MKIREIIRENADSRINNILSTLLMMQSMGDEKGVPFKIKTDSLIQHVRNRGDTTFNYAALVAAKESDTSVGAIITNMNREVIELNTEEVETDDAEVSLDDNALKSNNPYELSPEETVTQMAKKSLGKRQ